MAVIEQWVLDGVALAGVNFEILELTDDPPKARPDFVTSADSEGAMLLRRPQHENRTITMKLRVAQQASMNAALDQVGVILDKLRLASATPDGIDLVWTPANSTRTCTFDVIHGEIPELPIGLDGQAYSWFKQRPIFTVEMTCKPYGVGTETLTSTASSGATPFATIEVAGVTGDVPALGRLIVTDTATQNRRHLEWGVESQYYTPGAPLSLILESDSLSVSGLSGVQTTRTGSYDPGAAGNNTIRATMYPITTAIVSTGNQSHIGTYRVKARVWATSTDVSVRLAWRQGDTDYTTNAYANPPVGAAFCEIDLGTIMIAPVLAGTQRWVGRVEGYSTTSGDTVDIDYLELVPAGEGYGKARGPTPLETVTSPSAHDEFDQTAAVLTGKVAPLGGTWAGAGDADDFSVDATFHYALRVGVSDADVNTGRYMTLGTTTFTDVLVQGDFYRTGISAYPGVFTQRYGVLARYVDVNNWLMAVIEMAYQTPISQATVKLIKRVTGTATTLKTYQLANNEATSINGTLRLVVDASGNAIVFYGPNATLNVTDRNPQRVILATDTVLATGGALATGKVGFYDAWTGALALARIADNFLAAVPAPTQVIYSGRSAQVRYDETIRFDSTGTYYGRPPLYRGSRFLLPPGTSRVLAKARRQDVDTAPDDVVTDATQIQVGWTPRYLAVPR